MDPTTSMDPPKKDGSDIESLAEAPGMEPSEKSPAMEPTEEN